MAAGGQSIDMERERQIGEGREIHETGVLWYCTPQRLSGKDFGSHHSRQLTLRECSAKRLAMKLASGGSNPTDEDQQPQAA